MDRQYGQRLADGQRMLSDDEGSPGRHVFPPTPRDQQDFNNIPDIPIPMKPRLMARHR